MAAKEVNVTREGLKKLQAELEELKTVRRKEVAEKIKTARGYGDLSENAEYDAAKEEQGIIEAKIADLEATIKVAHVIDDTELNLNAVAVGVSVTILADGDDEEDAETYTITGSTEANIEEGKISDECPVGMALIGKKVGDTAEVMLPNGGTVLYKVLKIFRANV